MGSWISVEGAEAAGKSTLVAELRRMRPDWIVLSGFTSTPLGRVLAAGFENDPYVPQRPASAQAMMVLADFLIRWTNEIKPAIQGGRTVLTDRGWLSKFVYQIAILQMSQDEDTVFNQQSVKSVMSSIPHPAYSTLVLPDLATIEYRLREAREPVGTARRAMLRRILNLFDEYAHSIDNVFVVRGVQHPVEVAERMLEQIDALASPARF
jgi:thymidylate kinase